MSERTRRAVVGALPVPTSRAVKATDSASVALSALDEHDSIAILTFGQFSIGDAIRALLGRSGPAAVTVATWTAAKAEIEHAYRLLTDRRVLSMRWLVDRSFATRQPEYCRALIDRFGPDAIRTTRSHAKFVVVVGERDVFSVHTSANLNTNPRLESMQVIRGAEHAAWLSGIVDDLWAEIPPGEMNGGLPGRVETDDSPPVLRMGATVRTGP